MEFVRAVTSRRMTRSFSREPVPRDLLLSLIDLGSRAPSAGKTQGWSVLVLEGAEVATYWDLTLPAHKRDNFAWPHLLNAPVILLPFANPLAYVERYSEPDKERTGLGVGIDAWQTPYWTIDASFAVMTMLLAAQDAELGSLFFAVFNGAAEVREHFGVPHELELLGAIALGWPQENSTSRRDGRSASRQRKTPTDIAHFGHW